MTAAVLFNPGHFRHLNPFNDICEAAGLMNSPFKGFVLPATLGYFCEKPFPDRIYRSLDYMILLNWMLTDVLLLDNDKHVKHNNADFLA